MFKICCKSDMSNSERISSEKISSGRISLGRSSIKNYKSFHFAKESNLKKKEILEKAIYSYFVSNPRFEINSYNIYLVPMGFCEEDAKYVLKVSETSYDLNIYNPYNFRTDFSFEKDFKYHLKNSKEDNPFDYFICFIILDNKVYPCGVLHLYSGTSDDEISLSFCVLTNFQSMGIGKAMVNSAIDIIRKARSSSHPFYKQLFAVKRIETTVEKNNISSNKVFQKLNFVRHGPSVALAFMDCFQYVLYI